MGNAPVQGFPMQTFPAQGYPPAAGAPPNVMDLNKAQT